MGLAEAGDPPDPEGGGAGRGAARGGEAAAQRLTQYTVCYEVQVRRVLVAAVLRSRPPPLLAAPALGLPRMAATATNQKK